MKKITLILLSAFFCFNTNAEQKLKLWYDEPAQQWEEALPVGNGFIGAMIWGNAKSELIELNESSLWSGGPRKDNVNPDAINHFQPLREALLNKKFEEAKALCRNMQGDFTEGFLPLGAITLNQKNLSETQQNYIRELDIENAISKVAFTDNGINYVRECFVSAPDSVMIYKISADKKGSVSFDLNIDSKLLHNTNYENGIYQFYGNAPYFALPSYYNPQGKETIKYTSDSGTKGMRFNGLIKPLNKGGEIKIDKDGVHAHNCDEVIIIFSAATSFNGFDKCPDKDGKDEKAIALNRLNNAVNKKYSNLK